MSQNYGSFNLGMSKPFRAVYICHMKPTNEYLSASFKLNVHIQPHTSVIPICLSTCDRSTQFRWVQNQHGDEDTPSWGLSDIYVGEACPGMCNGHGTCKAGKCKCDDGFEGQTFRLVLYQFSSNF